MLIAAVIKVQPTAGTTWRIDEDEGRRSNSRSKASQVVLLRRSWQRKVQEEECRTACDGCNP